MAGIRKAAVAGMFYPADPAALRATVERLLAGVPGPWEAAPKGLIAPHAGYIYSGPVAATAYARLAPVRERIRRVVLLGPAHRYAVRGMAASSAEAFETPLGMVPVDMDSVQQALRLPQVQLLDEAHAGEHSLEVHLPFLQVVLAEFRIVPFVVGEAAPGDVAEVLELLWGGTETLLVVSSDLSHFLEDAAAKRKDGETARLIESCCFDQLDGRRACGYVPVGGLLRSARERGLAVKAVDLRNSSDTAGDPSRVVGYGAFTVG